MITFVLSLFALVIGYFIYGRIVERIFGPDDRPTPAISMADGVDYVVLPGWKVFMIQFLNIAGTGPIFGAIMGAKFGPSAYLWIVLGCIFAGAVHDYLSGMLSMRHGGAGLPELVGINYNINYYEMIARMAIGEDPREVFAKKADVETAGLAKMIISPERSGIIKNIAYKGKEDPDVCEVTFFKHEGDEVCKFTNSKDCIGQLIVKGKDMNACEKKEQEVLSQIVLDLE